MSVSGLLPKSFFVSIIKNGGEMLYIVSPGRLRLAYHTFCTPRTYTGGDQPRQKALERTCKTVTG